MAIVTVGVGFAKANKDKTKTEVIAEVIAEVLNLQDEAAMQSRPLKKKV